MAYVSQYLTDEEKKQQQLGSGGGAAGVNTSGVTNAYTSSSPTGSSTAPTASTPGTGFVDLQKYLSQNQGAGARMADTITKPLASQADTFKTTAAQTVKDAGQAFSAAGGAAQSGAIQDSLKADPTAAYDAASRFVGQGYEGPAATDYSANLGADASRLADSLGKVGDAGYTQTALADTYGKNGPYTSGFGELDNFLVHGDAGGRAKLDEVKARGQDVTDTASKAAGQLSHDEQAARETLRANQQHVRDTAGLKKADIEKDAGGRVARQSLTGLLNPDHKDASLGDVLSAKDISDLEHLATLTGTGNNADWYKKTFQEGHKPPPPPPPPLNISVAPMGSAPPPGYTPSNNKPADVPSQIGGFVDKANPLKHPGVQTTGAKPFVDIPKLGGSIAGALKNAVANLPKTGSVAASLPNIPISLPPPPPPLKKAADKLNVKKWH